MGHVFPWATKEYILYGMTGVQVELYFNQALKLLGERLFLYIDKSAPKKNPFRQTSPGDVVTRFEASSFSTNEDYEKALKMFGGRIKRG